MIENQYFGNCNLYKKIVGKSNVSFVLYEAYEKTAHLNRTSISGANGIISLNIPLIGGREQRLPLSLVRVSHDENWRRTHLRSIVSSYRRSPWFDHFADDLADFYKLDHEFLWEWNQASIRWILSTLKLDHQIEEVIVRHPEDWQQKPEHPVERSVKASEIQPYPQVFEDRFGFIPDLSILDTLFCIGPKSTRAYIMGG